MRRFAKLTRGGRPCYVDPDECGPIFANADVRGDGSHPTTILQKGIGGGVLLDGIDEPPDEVYRRLAAAGEVVTAADVRAAEEALVVVISKTGERLRRFFLTVPNESTAKMEAAAAVGAIADAMYHLKSTVLAALYTAEGREAQKE